MDKINMVDDEIALVTRVPAGSASVSRDEMLRLQQDMDDLKKQVTTSYGDLAGAIKALQTSIELLVPAANLHQAIVPPVTVQSPPKPVPKIEFSESSVDTPYASVAVAAESSNKDLTDNTPSRVHFLLKPGQPTSASVQKKEESTSKTQFEYVSNV